MPGFAGTTATSPVFIDDMMAACRAGDFTQIAGRRVISFRRNGESHVEEFPTRLAGE